MAQRVAEKNRQTRETNINLKLNLDGQGKANIDTKIPFLNHMLELFTYWGLFDLEINAEGDLDVDIHHTNEDIGICLGEVFKEALEDKKGISRIGFAAVPMDETLATVVLDISGRPSLEFHQVGGYLDAKAKEGYTMRDGKHFLKSFCDKSGINMRIKIEYGEDLHHMLEAVFKALGIALDKATQIDPRRKGIPSTKGKI